jgi:hypothetical protein
LGQRNRQVIFSIVPSAPKLSEGHRVKSILQKGNSMLKEAARFGHP